MLKPCPFCGMIPEWREFADARSAEFVGPHRVLECLNHPPGVTIRFQYHTDEWTPGKGTLTINRDVEFEHLWNFRRGTK